MAKKKRRRRTSLITKAINTGVLLLAFSRPIHWFLTQNPQIAATQIVREATAGMSEGGGFDQTAATVFYGPMVAAVILKKAISMVRKTARI